MTVVVKKWMGNYVPQKIDKVTNYPYSNLIQPKSVKGDQSNKGIANIRYIVGINL